MKNFKALLKTAWNNLPDNQKVTIIAVITLLLSLCLIPIFPKALKVIPLIFIIVTAYYLYKATAITPIIQPPEKYDYGPDYLKGCLEMAILKYSAFAPFLLPGPILEDCIGAKEVNGLRFFVYKIQMVDMCLLKEEDLRTAQRPLQNELSAFAERHQLCPYFLEIKQVNLDHVLFKVLLIDSVHAEEYVAIQKRKAHTVSREIFNDIDF